MSESHSTHESNAPLDRAKELAQRGELSEALEAAASGADRRAIVKAHEELARWLCNSRKDPDAMLACGKAGVRLGLAGADMRDAGDDALDRDLKRAAQILANNVAANCWPGWGDEGIVLTADHVKEGLALAETSLSICQALGPSPEQLANGRWLIGALQFSVGDHEAALASFDLAEQANLQAEKRVEALMARGYQFLVMKRSPAAAEEAAAELDKILATLSEDGSKPAQFFAQQLRTADALL